MQHNNIQLNVSAICCPTKHSIKKENFKTEF